MRAPFLPSSSSIHAKFAVLCIAILFCVFAFAANAQFDNRQTLTVAKEGRGTISSRPAGIFCGVGCDVASELFDFGELVEVRARPDSGWRFDRWTGFCTGSGDCELIMISSRTVVAIFVQNGSPPPDNPPNNPPNEPTAPISSPQLPSILQLLLND